MNRFGEAHQGRCHVQEVDGELAPVGELSHSTGTVMRSGGGTGNVGFHSDSGALNSINVNGRRGEEGGEGVKL